VRLRELSPQPVSKDERTRHPDPIFVEVGTDAIATCNGALVGEVEVVEPRALGGDRVYRAARDLLAAVYDGLTESFDTKDLMAPKTLLDELA
jgi:hypothetical protein